MVIKLSSNLIHYSTYVKRPHENIINKHGRMKLLKLPEHNTWRALFFLKKGHFLKIKRAVLGLLQNLGGTCLKCPSSYIYVNKTPRTGASTNLSLILGTISPMPEFFLVRDKSEIFFSIFSSKTIHVDRP